MARKKRVEVMLAPKFMYIGCKSLGEMIQRAEDEVASLRELAAAGAELMVDEVEDWSVFLELRTSDPALIKKYQSQNEVME